MSAIPVLIAEDDRGTRNLYRFLLGVAGYPVIEAPDAHTALRELVSHTSGMVALLDWEMPRAGCMRILRGLALEPDAAALHRYVLLAREPERIRGHILSLPASLAISLLRTPVSRDDLLAAVRRSANLMKADSSRILQTGS